MRSSRVNYFLVGGFVIAMVVGLLAALALLTGRTGATDDYFAMFDNVTGIKFGSQVLYEGYPIGQVEEVTPIAVDGRMRFRVDLSVREGWRIPEDSIAEIGASGLLAAVTINVEAGRSATAIEPESQIPSRPTSNVFATVSQVAATIARLADDDLRPLLDSMNRSVTLFGDVLESDGQVLVREMTKLAVDVSARLPRIGADIEEITGKVRGATSQIEALMTPENRQKAESVLTQMDAATRRFADLSADLVATRGRLDQLLDTAGAMVSDNKLDIERTIVDMRYVVDSVARNIDALNYNLEGASRNMHEFSRQIRQNPGLLLGGTPPADEARR